MGNRRLPTCKKHYMLSEHCICHRSKHQSNLVYDGRLFVDTWMDWTSFLVKEQNILEGLQCLLHKWKRILRSTSYSWRACHLNPVAHLPTSQQHPVAHLPISQHRPVAHLPMRAKEIIPIPRKSPKAETRKRRSQVATVLTSSQHKNKLESKIRLKAKSSTEKEKETPNGRKRKASRPGRSKKENEGSKPKNHTRGLA